MPLHISVFSDDPQCAGHAWTVTDEDKLARLVARLLVGHYRHVQSILLSNTPAPVGAAQGSLQMALSQVEAATESARWHRDGWIFQMISWIAARLTYPDLVASTPHPRPSNKGFDALLVRLDNLTLNTVIICEDKATESPRKTIRDDVWPGFRECEEGRRDGELQSEVTAILERSHPGTVDAIVEAIHWDLRRAYRVSVTVDWPVGAEEQRKALFQGYDAIISGACERRTAETLHVNPLRSWMDSFCLKVRAALTSLPAL